MKSPHQCQFAEDSQTQPRCREKATRKWGDCWFCETHGRRDINTDNHIPTKTERITNYKAIMKMHPANRFRLMFGQTLLQEPKP